MLIGVEPVAKPRTAFGFYFIKFAMISAATVSGSSVLITFGMKLNGGESINDCDVHIITPHQ